MAAADSDFLFRDLLRDQMQRDGRNARKLAADTNESWGHIPGYLSVEKSTIRNWVRNNDPSTPRNWIQLAAICKELDVTRQVAEAMFLATTREMVLDDLRNKAGDSTTELLTFRNELALVSSNQQPDDSTSLVAASNKLEPLNPVSPAGRVKRSYVVGAVAVASLIAAASFFVGQQTRPDTVAPAAPTIETTTTQPAPTGPPQITIEGPSTVECWGDHETYTAVQTGGEKFTEWVWETGSLGLQTPWNVGPEAVLSFTTVPGTYTIKLVNPGEGVIAEKQIELTPALGCSGDPTLPQPSIRGPGQVVCGSEGFYRVANTGAEITEASWTSESINIIEPTPAGAELTFPTKPGLYTVTLTVNQGLTTSRTFTVNTGTLCQE